MLDAYWQWATNPTPPASGYALDENLGFIHTNLLLRYGQPAVALVRQLAAETAELQQGASVYDLQQAVLSVLSGMTGSQLRAGVARRLSEAVPARRLLAAWVIARSRWQRRGGRPLWVGGESDWSLGPDLLAGAPDPASPVALLLFGPECRTVDLVREAMLTGLVNRLFYRSPGGVAEPRLRPGPRVALQQLSY